MEMIIELLREILQRLTRIEAQSFYSTASTSLHNRAVNRYESLERYRVAYNRQNGFPDEMVHPANPDAEDEID
jgi:hypothetical protein